MLLYARVLLVHVIQCNCWGGELTSSTERSWVLLATTQDPLKNETTYKKHCV